MHAMDTMDTTVGRRFVGSSPREPVAPAPHRLVARPAPTLITPRRGWGSPGLAELWRHRELLGFLVWRDVAVRYKQTLLGVLWAVLQPTLKMVVFTLVFGRLVGVASQGAPYPVFVYAGLLPWQFFAEALGRSSHSVMGSAGLITKVYFPRLVIPLASVGSCLLDFAISFAVLIALMCWYGLAPTASLFAVGPLVGLTVVAALGAGTLASALNVAYRDVRYVIPLVVQVWMFLTPVIYPVTVIPQDWRWLAWLNPMSGLVDGYRSAILGRPFAWDGLAASAAVSTAMLLVGVAYFKRVERRFADIV